MKRKLQPRAFHHQPQAGMTLIETVIALAMLFVVTVGIMSIAVVAIQTTENQGHLSARTAEYAQDKIEQLMGLAFNDAQTDTTVFPSAATGGTGLAAGGSFNPATPATGYVDYLDVTGTPLPLVGGAAPPGWYYIRVWQISNPPIGGSNMNMKQITVTSKVAYGIGSSGSGALAQSTAASLKTSPY